MSQATANEQCMLFVGGNDYKSNSPTGQQFAGGCTKAWWDAEVASTNVLTAMGKLMGADGEPIATVSTTSHSLYNIGGTNYVKVTDSVGTGFADVEVGMLVYHPDSTYMFNGGTGIYKIREVGVSGDYIVLDTTWAFEGYPQGNDGNTIFVGGAWNSLDTFIDNYVDASDYSHEVWVNKDLSFASEWDWSGWSGSVQANTWLTVTGFHRVPGDITDPDGVYHQTAKDMFDNGVDADCLVEVDLGTYGANSVISESNSYNIRMSGFNFCNGVAGCEMFAHVSGNFDNFDFVHNAFEISALWYIDAGKNVFFIDCFFEHSGIYVSGTYMFAITAVNMVFINNYFKNMDGFGSIAYDGICHLHRNVFQIRTGGSSYFNDVDSAGRLYSYNNTFVGFDGTDGVFMNQGYDSSVFSINDLIYNGVKTSPAYHVGWLGGTYIIKNPCVYAENGQLDDVMTVDPTSPFITQISEIPGLLEVDPLLDADYEPLEQQVRTGGLPDILGDATSIGAIQTMNTTVINSAVQAALSSGGVKLAADGLDDVVIAEPSGDSSGWSFAQGLKWLIMRFSNKHTSDNFSGIVVHKTDGTVSTSQAVTEVDGVKSVGLVQ